MLAVAQKAAGGKPKCELGHIFQQYGEEYRRTHSLPLSHRKVMRAIERCRTAQLGGHLDQCETCGYQHPAYNSCRDRHCPKCQSLAKAQWVEKAEPAKLLKAPPSKGLGFPSPSSKAAILRKSGIASKAANGPSLRPCKNPEEMTHPTVPKPNRHRCSRHFRGPGRDCCAVQSSPGPKNGPFRASRRDSSVLLRHVELLDGLTPRVIASVFRLKLAKYRASPSIDKASRIRGVNRRGK